MASQNGGSSGSALASAYHSHLPELEAILQQDGGTDALQMVEKILENIRRFPGNEKYRCVNLTKVAGQKVLPALPLLEVAGFERLPLATGEDGMQLLRLNSDVIEKVWAMTYWSTRGYESLKALPLPRSPLQSHALAAVLGAAIGDSLAAPLGGRAPLEVSTDEVDKAMEMCGGGIWGVAPGQCTGHSELMLCLAESLAEASTYDFQLFEEDLAVRYGKWGRSQPFRSERSCAQAFQRPMAADQLRQRAKDVNQKSMGSGALLRCTALAAAGAARNVPSKAANLARQEAGLSHPHATVGYASAVYTIACVYLIRNSGDRTAALGELQQWLEAQHTSIRDGLPRPSDDGPRGFTHLSRGAQAPVGKRVEEPSEWVPPGEELVALEEVMGWLKKAFGDSPLDFSDHSAGALLQGEVGSVEIPFEHAFRQLRLGSSFETAIRSVLVGGGDSCTNAAIVGGLLGAAVGLEGLPDRWVRALLASECSMGQYRPPEYHPERLPGLVMMMCGYR
eukprot:TRINITY_DN97071_c0_g1_i1.p1 TRINITY_DN97071_c0_g1~~TRINITY_DN97071_c0_g1_i1.p1  ORF type:complete len:527 (-),score=117.38 TRINITY_DN97071_c0_g1_i1:393-1913(-)